MLPDCICIPIWIHALKLSVTLPVIKGHIQTYLHSCTAACFIFFNEDFKPGQFASSFDLFRSSYDCTKSKYLAVFANNSHNQFVAVSIQMAHAIISKLLICT